MKHVNTDIMDKFEPRCCTCTHSCTSYGDGTYFCDIGTYFCNAGCHMMGGYFMTFTTSTKKPESCKFYKRKV